MTGAEVALYDPGLPAERDQWSREDFAVFLAAVDNRATWIKAATVAAFEVKYRDLQWLAGRTGIAHQTLKNYRSVWNAYNGTDVGTVPFGVADALRDQDDRLELVQREDLRTVAAARELVKSRREPPPAPPDPVASDDSAAEPGGQEPETPAAVPEPVTVITEPADFSDVRNIPGGQAAPGVTTGLPARHPGPAPQCPGCRSKDDLISDLQAQLEAAHAGIARLEASPPRARTAEVIIAERDFLAGERDRLAEANRMQEVTIRSLTAELAARPQEALIATQEPAPAAAPAGPPQEPDQAHADGQHAPEPVRQPCGLRDAGKVTVTADGKPVIICGELVEWLCREHFAAMTGRGATVRYAHAGEEEFGRCQYLVPVPEAVPA